MCPQLYNTVTGMDGGYSSCLPIPVQYKPFTTLVTFRSGLLSRAMWLWGWPLCCRCFQVLLSLGCYLEFMKPCIYMQGCKSKSANCEPGKTISTNVRNRPTLVVKGNVPIAIDPTAHEGRLFQQWYLTRTFHVKKVIHSTITKLMFISRIVCSHHWTLSTV